MEVMVEATRMRQVEKLFRERDIKYDVVLNDTILKVPFRRGRSPDVASMRLRTPINTCLHLPRKKFDWKYYYPLHYIYNFMDDLEKAFPSTCTVSIIGKTAEGRDIRLLKISNSDAGNTGVWIDATTHAREWISTSVVTYIADYIARNFAVLPVSVTNKDWYFLPVVNPDGYHYSHTTDRMWRKNRARIGCGGITGVDLNRNFSCNWGQTTYECQSSDPHNMNYRGPEPFSEPETIAIKDMILYSGTPFKVFLTFHSCSEVISFPWCHTLEPCPDYVSLLEGGTVMAKAIYETNGRMFKVGSFKDIMYNACGTSIDWSYGVAHIPFSYLVELRSKTDRFILPKEEILDSCKETLNGLMALIAFVDRKKCLNCTIIAKTMR